NRDIMYLPAISIGYAVPTGNFDASIHSVFQSAINLRLNAGDRLLTLVTSNESDLPQGIRLDTSDGFSFEGFQTGEAAVCRDGILHFENSSLTIQLHGARRWKCDLPALEFDTTKPAVAAAWSFVWGALNKRQIQSDAEIIAEDLFHSNERGRFDVTRKAGGAMRGLFEATQQFDLTAASSSIEKLIGLGAGLTPSGDDLLVGYLAGLWCAVWDKSERAQFVTNLGKVVVRLSGQTNDISRTYLYHASRGQVLSRLADLAEAICRRENPDRLLATAESAMQAGHTSGMDAVTGLLMGLAAWEGNHLLSI
ncbi:MAG: DUF2877 domain-containing protein, partial [Anaerolineales bacterium]